MVTLLMGTVAAGPRCGIRSVTLREGAGWQVNRDGEGGLCSNFRATLAFQQIKVRIVPMLCATAPQLMNMRWRGFGWQAVGAEQGVGLCWCGLVRAWGFQTETETATSA